jgi:putative ABC transport system ATP-binding protein
VISLRQVEKCYETKAGKTWVLRRINLDIREGELVTVMGPSGAGKSTLLAIIGMLDGEWQGEYRFEDHEVHTMSVKERLALHKRYFGFVFQQYHLIDDLTVAENLARNGRRSSPTPSTASAWWRRRTCSRRSSPVVGSSWSRSPAR